MIRIRRSALLLTSFALACSATPAFAQVFFRMDYSAAAEPNGGWEAIAPDSRFQRLRVPGGGPSGQDAYELRQISVPGMADSGGQFNWGWRANIEPSDPPTGSRRYYRWRMWFSPTTNFRALDWDNGAAGNLTNKLLIVGQGCGSNRCRVILNHNGERSDASVSFRLQIDGGADAVDTPSYQRGQWLHVQVELDASSSGSTADGGYKMWVNNNDYSRPSAQRTGIVLNASNWRYVWLGAFMNDGLASDGIHVWRQTDFQAATSFDNAWASGGSGGGGGGTVTPTAPRNLRIVP